MLLIWIKPRSNGFIHGREIQGAIEKKSTKKCEWQCSLQVLGRMGP